jgi:TetR/AcrR family transcriptional regulator, cholesterol catabolism regulator
MITTFQAFKGRVNLSSDEICRDFLAENRGRIRVKKDETAIKNLVKIFDATLAESSRRGFPAMSVRDLSRETGLSMGALYTYFRGKEDLLDMILHHGQRILMRVLEEEIRNGNDSGDKLIRAIETHLYLSEVMRPWFFFAYMEAKNLGPEGQKKAIAMELCTERVLVDILRAGRKSGRFRPVDPTLAAAVIKAMLQDWYLKGWKYRRRRVSVEEYARFLVGVVGSFVLGNGREE